MDFKNYSEGSEKWENQIAFDLIYMFLNNNTICNLHDKHGQEIMPFHYVFYFYFSHEPNLQENKNQMGHKIFYLINIMNT